MSDTQAAQELERLAEQASTCTACRLAGTRTNVVFGDGSTRAQVMFIGEGPGRNEDLQGLPFVGAAGQLLNQLLSEIGLQRSDAYIANVVKCRPPGNRDPRPDEIAACKGYLLAGPAAAAMGAKCTSTIPAGFPDDWAALVSAAMASNVCNQPADGGKCNPLAP